MVSGQNNKTYSKDEVFHNRDLLLALSRVAQASQKARTAEDFYDALGTEIKSLGGEVALLLLSEDARSLVLKFASYSSKSILIGEKVTGIITKDYQFEILPESIYARKLASGHAEFVHWDRNHIADAMPEGIRFLADQIISIFHFDNSILAPLRVEEGTLGLMVVSGMALAEEDAPAMDSFAGQVAAGLHTLHLMQKLQAELAERRRAEQALKESDEKIHALLDAIPDLYFVLSLEGVFLDYHVADGVSLYAAPETFMGKNIRDVLPSEMVQIYFLNLEKAKQSGGDQLFEYSFNMPKGSRYFEAHLAVYQSNKVLCLVRDVTERKHVDEKIQQAQKYFQALIENAPDGISVVGDDGKITYASPSALRMFGYDLDEVAGVNPVELVHPDDIHIVLTAINDVIQTPEYKPVIEYRYKHRNGVWHWVESIFSNLLAEPSVQAVVINFRDISDRKNAEAKMYLQSAALDAAANSIVITDRQGFVEWANSAFENLTGFSKEEAIGKNQRDLVKSGRQSREFYHEMWEKITSGEVWRNELINRHKDGHLYYEEMTITPLRGEDGEINHFIAVKQEITERKQAEDALHRQIENLNDLYRLTVVLGQISKVEDLYQAALDSLYNTLGVDRASILLFDEDGVMRFKAWRDLSDGYRQRAQGHSPWSQDSQNPQPVLVADVEEEPSLETLRPVILGEGIRSLGFIPLIHQDKLLGKFMLYFNAPHVFSREEVQMAQTIAHHVVIAIARQQAEQELAESERHYRLLAERMADVVWIVDLKSLKFRYISPSVTKMLGYSVAEMQNLRFEDFIDSHSFSRMMEGTPQRIEAFQSGDPSAVTKSEMIDHRTRDGALIHTEAMTTFVRNEKDEIEVIGVSRDITERQLANEELHWLNQSLENTNRELHQMFAHEQVLARTDSLTNLYNRRHFFDLANHEFNAGVRYQRPLTIILFDIDGFKHVNDHFGHIMGDRILTQIAQVASAQVRGVDILARYGGDEFIILLPQTLSQQAFVVAERIRVEVESLKMESETGTLQVTLSIGIAEMLQEPQDRSVEDVIRRADQALYQVKNTGRNHTTIYSEE